MRQVVNEGFFREESGLGDREKGDETICVVDC